MQSTNLSELQEFVSFLFDLPDTYRKAKADGKIDLADIQYVFPLFSSAQRAIDGLGNPLERWRALDPEEREVVLYQIRQRFDLPDDVLESLIERGFEQAIKFAELVADVVAYTRKDDDAANV